MYVNYFMVVCCVNMWFVDTEAFMLHLLKVSIKLA